MKDTFWFVVGAGVVSDNLFDNIFNIRSVDVDDLPLELKVMDGFELFGIVGDTWLAFDEDWGNGSNKDGGIESEWYNKCLIKCSIKAEL